MPHPDDESYSVGGTLGVTPSANLALTAGYTRNFIDVPDGSFTADLGSLRVSYAVSTRLVANALVQYNSLDNALSANVRVNFIHRPGSDLFIVFNEQRGSDEGLWDLDNRGAALKLTYLKRF